MLTLLKTEQETIEDGLIDHGYLACVTMAERMYSVVKRGTKRLCTKLYKERLFNNNCGSTKHSDGWSVYNGLSERYE